MSVLLNNIFIPEMEKYMELVTCYRLHIRITVAFCATGRQLGSVFSSHMFLVL